jgi:membrane-associated protein
MLEMILHVDRYLVTMIENFGAFSYLFLFLIVFAETGLVVTPFLPGDSLLFATGTFAAVGSFNLFWLFAVLSLAAIIGDSVNYAVGKFLGEKLCLAYPRIIKKEYLDKTHQFYEKYGGKTIVIARFVPIVRTFAPFVAGIGKMGYPQFLFFNVSGGLLWVTLFVGGGYFFGNIPIIKENFSITILIIIILSILPAIIEVLKHRRKS